MTGLRAQLRELRRAASWHRRVLAAGLAAGAVAAGLHAAAPPALASVSVLVAVRDVPGGSALDPADLRTAQLPEALAPAGALSPETDLDGAVLAAPLAPGEVLTAARLVGPSLLAGHGTALVGVPIRLADAAVARLLHAGDLIDVFAADTSGVALDGLGTTDGSVGDSVADSVAGSGRTGTAAAHVVAPAVRVLAVLVEEGDGAFAGTGDAGALIVVAAAPDVAADLAGAEASARLSVALRPD